MSILRIRAAFNSPAKRRPKNLSAVLRNTAGAIDLASIMIGVLVLGIIGGTISATVFAVIPWSQDEAAKATLNEVRIAESTYLVNSPTGAYADLAQLQAPLTFASGSGSPRQPAASVTTAGAPLLPASNQPLAITANTQGWAAVATSASGQVFYATNLNTTVTTTVPTLPAGLTAPVPAGLTAPASTTWDATAASSALRGYLTAQAEYYKSHEGYNAAGPTELGFAVPAGLTIYNADNLAGGQGLMNSGEGMYAVVTDGTNTLYAGVAMGWPASTNWSAPDYSTVTYTIDVPVSALDTTAMTNLVGYGYITAPEIQYRTYNTLTALGIADPNGPGACTASGTIDVTCP